MIGIIEQICNKLSVDSPVPGNLNRPSDIKRDYSNYWDCFKLAKSLPDFKKRVNALQNLLNKMLEDYHPSTFDLYTRDLAYEFSLWDEYKNEEPPYSSISTEVEEASIQFTKAKIFLLYSEVRDALFLYRTMLSQPNDNTNKNDSTYDEKTLIINQIIIKK